MRYFRQLPPTLRVVALFGLLCVLGSIAILLSVPVRWFLTQLPLHALISTRVLTLGLNLSMLSLTCTFVVNAYGLRFRQATTQVLLLSSRASQMKALLLLATLPLCSLATALFLQSGDASLNDLLLMLVSMASAVSLLVAYLWLATRTAVRT